MDGAIKISNTTNTSTEEGTIRWTGTDFEGKTNSGWSSLTSSSSNNGSGESMYNEEYVNILFHNNTDIVTVFNSVLGVWNSTTLAYPLTNSDYQLRSSKGNFLLFNTTSPIAYVYDS